MRCYFYRLGQLNLSHARRACRIRSTPTPRRMAQQRTKERVRTPPTVVHMNLLNGGLVMLVREVVRVFASWKIATLRRPLCGVTTVHGVALSVTGVVFMAYFIVGGAFAKSRRLDGCLQTLAIFFSLLAASSAVRAAPRCTFCVMLFAFSLSLSSFHAFCLHAFCARYPPSAHHHRVRLALNRLYP